MHEKVYISFADSIKKKQVEEFIGTCNKAIQDHSPKSLHILFSSPGGNINLAFILLSFLKAIPVKIIMHGSGRIDSCGLNVFFAGDERYAAKGTTVLIHGATRSFGKDVTLSMEQLHSELISLQEDQKKITDNILDNTEFSIDEIKQTLLFGLTFDCNKAKEKGKISEVKEFIVDIGAPFLQTKEQNITP